ncbi:MAG: ABC transporter substrate-binding protein [Rhodocyclales bacterium]|nr:ABC transporter substrate-binding protein [Rhodocyclales bacterium]
MRLKLSLLACLAGIQIPPCQAAGPEPIRIGLTCPFTGGSAPMGESMRNGVRMAAEEINWKGGVLGRPIELVERDDEGNPDKGRAFAEELTGKARVVATIGSCNTGVVLKTIDLYQKAKIPLLVPVATGVAITTTFAKEAEHYIFRNSANDDIQAQLVAREAVERRHFRKVAVLHDTTAYGAQGKDFLLAALDKLGVKPVAVEAFPLGVQDLAGALDKARKAGAEIILTYTVGPELAVIANSRAKINWKAPIVGSWPLSWTNYLNTAKGNAEGARMPQTFIEEPTSSRRTEFILTYLGKYNLKRMSSAVSAAQGYDAMLILTAAIRQAGVTDGARIRAALEDLRERIPGVVSTYEHPFTKTDHEAVTASMVAMGEVRQGIITFAYKEDEKAAIVGRKRAN